MRGRVTRRRRFQALALGSLLALAGAAPAEAVLVDAVLGQVESAIVTASDIALARALGLFGFTPSKNAIDAADVDRYSRALGEVLEASRLGLSPTAPEIDHAWAALADRLGGALALQSWLDAVAIDAAWARRALEAHLRWRAWNEFHAHLSESPPAGAAPGSAPGKPSLGPDMVTHRLLAPSQTVTVPFPMPR